MGVEPGLSVVAKAACDVGGNGTSVTKRASTGLMPGRKE